MDLRSFDVFDTCLTRVQIQPGDLFYGVAENALPLLGLHGYSRLTMDEFVRLRKLAERLARQEQRRRREEITLSDIYIKFASISPWLMDIEVMMQVELAVERASLRPIGSMLARVRTVRADGHKVFFISDMYLPAWFIKECLQVHGFAEAHDEVYVSGDIGLSKVSGNLFLHVLRKNQIEPHQLTHEGDHILADYLVPQRLGICAVLAESAKLTRFERQGADATHSAVSSKLVGIGRLARLGLPEILEPNLGKIICNVAAPLLVGYVAWVLHGAKTQGVQRLYFVSRDGQILHTIAQRFVSHWGGVECKYLYGSRQSWFMPNLAVMAWNAIYSRFIRNQSTILADILARFGLEQETVSQVTAELGLDSLLSQPLTDSQLALFRQILERPEVQHQIQEKSSQAQEAALKYFAQEGLLADGRWALVDVGWRLHAQGALREILANADVNIAKNFFGYYMAVASDRADEPYQALIRGEDSSGHAWLFKKSASSILEQVFLLADHPTVTHYELGSAGSQPVFGSEEGIPKMPVELIQALHGAVLAYVDIALQNGFELAQGEALFRQGLRAFESLCMHPTSEDAQALAAFPVCIDQSHQAHLFQSMTKILRWRDLPAIVHAQLRGKPTPTGPVWLEGSAAQSAPSLRVFMGALLAAQRIRMRFTKRI